MNAAKKNSTPPAHDTTPAPKHESGTMTRVVLPEPTVGEAKAQYEAWQATYKELLKEKIKRDQEQWRITGHLDAEILPILDAAVAAKDMGSRAEWIVWCLKRALKVT